VTARDEAKGQAQLQEVYRHLDSSDGGNARLAWYGQLRAQEYSHEEALAMTIKEYKLERQDWYKVRFATQDDS
jgi:hypothetical protein